jgi:FixJ family two-component response regulator
VNTSAPRVDVPVGPTVFLVDDDVSTREGLGSLIRSVGLRVEMFSSGKDFLRVKRPHVPSCLVLDVRLPGLSGLDLQQELVVRNDRIPIIFITGHGDIPMTVRAMKAGAVEFLPKPLRDQDLIDAIHKAIERDAQMLKQQAAAADLRRRYETLTAREREVMCLIAAGLLNKQAAGELDTTERTIKFHRAHIMEKMGAGSLADLVRMAESLGVSSQT